MDKKKKEEKMYWWNTTQLASELKENKLSASSKMKYYLAGNIFLLIAFYLTSLQTGKPPIFTVVELILSIIIVIYGIRVTFKTNKGNDGKQYIARVICLVLPITIKITVLLFVIYLVLAISEEFIKLNLMNNAFIDLIFVVSMQILCFSG